MSNIDHEVDFSALTTALRFVLGQALKYVNTALPGIVETYDATTKRARVTPAIRLIHTDGTTETRAPIVNAPVVFPSGGGFTLLFPVAVGDAVLLVFSERGLTQFKETFAESDPDRDLLFSEADAIVLPGFGALSVTPATTTGASLQSEDGGNSIQIETDGITIETAGHVEIAAESVNIESNTLTHNDTNISDDHVHGGVQSGSSDTGPPS